MATIDEQRMREQFEAHFHSLGHSELLTRHPDGFYATASVRNEWRGFQDGYRARDAEVQALREALIEIRDGLEWVYMDRRAEDSFLRALRQAGRALRQVDAALAGEGGVSE